MSDGGTAWRFGDNIDTDVLAPGIYMKRPIEELARHCLEAVDPRFATAVEPGDIVVAGRNFGMGSSREQAAQALRRLGIAAVLAQSFAGIFYRNALNLGLLALVCPGTERIGAGDRLAVDGVQGVVSNLTTGERLRCEPLPPHLLRMVEEGGLVPYLEKKLAAKRGTA
jgi:3-isopropylmalate/(R)-2-methylmalate dehydratase small subunit